MRRYSGLSYFSFINVLGWFRKNRYANCSVFDKALQNDGQGSYCLDKDLQTRFCYRTPTSVVGKYGEEFVERGTAVQVTK